MRTLDLSRLKTHQKWMNWSWRLSKTKKLVCSRIWWSAREAKAKWCRTAPRLPKTISEEEDWLWSMDQNILVSKSRFRCWLRRHLQQPWFLSLFLTVWQQSTCMPRPKSQQELRSMLDKFSWLCEYKNRQRRICLWRIVWWWYLKSSNLKLQRTHQLQWIPLA